MTAAMSGPTAASIGAGAYSTTVTWAPAATAAVASSAPISPAPAIASRSPGRSSARSASASSSVRRVRCAPGPGSRTGSDPVASTSASNGYAPPVAVRSTPSSSAQAASPSRAVIPSAPGSNGSDVSSMTPAITFLDSGGRSYGGLVSAPISVISPPNPRSLSCSTVRRPARPAPATTTRLLATIT